MLELENTISLTAGLAEEKDKFGNQYFYKDSNHSRRSLATESKLIVLFIQNSDKGVDFPEKSIISEVCITIRNGKVYDGIYIEFPPNSDNTVNFNLTDGDRTRGEFRLLTKNLKNLTAVRSSFFLEELSRSVDKINLAFGSVTLYTHVKELIIDSRSICNRMNGQYKIDVCKILDKDDSGTTKEYYSINELMPQIFKYAKKIELPEDSDFKISEFILYKLEDTKKNLQKGVLKTITYSFLRKFDGIDIANELLKVMLKNPEYSSVINKFLEEYKGGDK